MRYVGEKWIGFLCALSLGLAGCTGSDDGSNDVDGFFDTDSVGEIGGAPLAFTPATYDFGNVALATSSADQALVMNNSSGIPLTITSITEASQHFSIPSHDCPAELPSGQSCSIQVRFTPQNSGYLGASIQVAYEAKGKPLAAGTGVSGTGVGDLVFTGIDTIDQVSPVSVRLNWTHDVNAANYFIFRINAGVPTLIDNVSAPTATYTVTGLTPGTAYTFRVRAQDLLGTIENNTNDIPVTTDTAPVLTTVNDLNFPANFVDVGDNVAIDVNNVNKGAPGTDAFMTYSCTFDRIVDDAVAAGTNCASLPGTVDVTNLAAAGALSWTPDATAYGAFEIKITGTNSGLTDDEVFVVDVRQAYDRTQLALDFDAQFADLTGHGVNPLAVWSNLLNGVATGALFNFDYNGSSGWFGDGTQDNPFLLELDGVNDYADLGNGLAANSELLILAWINPADTSTGDATILSTGGGAANGIRIRQNGALAGSLEFAVGSSGGASDHPTAVLADSPVGYWRMGQTGTVTNSGTVGAAINGTLSGGYSDSTSLVFGSGNATTFDGTDGAMSIPNNAAINDGGGPYSAISVELWFQADSLTGFQYLYEQGGGTNGLGIYLEDDTLYCQIYSQSSSWGGTGNPGGVKIQTQGGILTDTAYHVVLTFSEAQDRLRCYLNGVSMGADVTGLGQLDDHSGDISVGHNGNSYNYAGVFNDASYFDGAIDELAIFGTELTAVQVGNHYNPAAPKCTTASLLSNSTWALLSASYDGSVARLFVDQTLACSFALDSLDPASQNLTLGRDPDRANNYWNGSVAHVVAYNEAPTGNPTVDVADFYGATKERFPRDYATVLLAHNPIAYWRLGEAGTADNLGSLGAAVDGTYNGTYANATSLVSSDGNSTHFDGSSGYILFPDSTSINTGGPYTQRSIELWFNADDLTGTQMLFEEGGSGNGYSIYLDGSNLYCQAWSSNQGWGTTGDPGGVKLVSQAVSVSTTYQVVLTFNSTQDRLRCYVNGAQVGGDVNGIGDMNAHSGDISVGYSTDGSYIHSGAFGAGGYFDGVIDEVSIFDTELTSGQVSEHYLPR